VSIVDNWLRSGPDTHLGAAAVTRQTIGAKGAPRVYMAGNHADEKLLPQTPNVAEVIVSQPPCPLISPLIPAADAYERVLNRAGAFPRNSIDRRIVSDVRNRSGSIVS
jgi:hypothetical protein